MVVGQASAEDLEAVAVLREPLRRRLYDFVVTREHPVSRDEAAEAVGLSRQSAAFHLDRLAEVGLVGVEFARRNGRSGPGAGRPSKLYHRLERRIEVQLPPRADRVAAEVLARAVDAACADGGDVAVHLTRLGHEAGSERARVAGPGLPGAMTALSRLGYAPRRASGRITLASCPFTAGRERSAALEALSLAIVRGVLAGSGGTGLRAQPADQPGPCPVALVPVDETA